MTTRLTPLGYTVLIKADEVEEVSDGGIVLTSSKEAKKLQQHGQMMGTVVKIGVHAWSDKVNGRDGNTHDPWVEPGDRIIFRQYAGKFVYDPDTEEEFVISQDEDIVCKIEES